MSAPSRRFARFSLMPLPVPKTSRALRHVRSIATQAFERDDGLWDIEARLTDTKPHAIQLASGQRAAGAPVHDLWLRLTVDTQFNILDADAVSDAVPYPGHCDAHGDAYKQLVGLNLLKGFRHAVRERLGGIAGCTHLTELAAVMPTARHPPSADSTISPGAGLAVALLKRRPPTTVGTRDR